MQNRWREWFSIQSTKNPRKMILLGMLIFNIGMIIVGSLIIKGLSLTGTESMPFLQAVFCTISMMLDPGCISFVVEDVGESGVLIAMICFCIIVFGMVSFTGAVIGYVTNAISAIIEASDSASRTLYISDHFVILNWNNRAAEIVNDLLYLGNRQKVVVLVSEGKARIERIIEEKLQETIHRENSLLDEKYGEGCAPKGKYLKNNLTIIVREGDVYSHQQLMDIAIQKARTVIILGADEVAAAQNRMKKKGNAQTVKTLMQVADITGAAGSNDDQNIIVEVTDPWTMKQVQHIIDFKEVQGKCRIRPIRINQVLGQILSQFTILPELNDVYSELFSNYGATIYSIPHDKLRENHILDYMATHNRSIPLVVHEEGEDVRCYYMAGSEADVHVTCPEETDDLVVDINEQIAYRKKTIVVFGRNSRYSELLEGYRSYLAEWPDSADVIIIDDRENIRGIDFFKKYPFVTETIAVPDYDIDAVRDAIRMVLTKTENDLSILILSDDQVEQEDIDADALSNLIFIETILNQYRKKYGADSRRIDVIVELIDPKHHDIVNHYQVDNVVISNRYISKMITQIGEKESLYNFFADILTYDREGAEEYTSKEIYVRRAGDFFRTLPPATTAARLIYAVAAAQDAASNSVILGYIRDEKDIRLFSGDLKDIRVELEPEDKLILFSAHI